MKERPWFFITGTDTGVGKTIVTTAYLKLAQEAGLRTLGVKPVAAGGVWKEGKLVNEDVELLLGASSPSFSYEDVNPITLEQPIAPHIAAQKSNVDLRLDALIKHCRTLREISLDLMLIEGAGGWLVPLDQKHTLADLCAALNVPVVLVVGMKLGCINHALLTQQSIRSVGLNFVGWVANCIDEYMEVLEDNIQTLKDRLLAPCLGIVHHSSADPIQNATKQLQLNDLLYAYI